MDELAREEAKRALEALAAEDAAAGLERSPLERLGVVLGGRVPELWPELEPVRRWALRLARDERGTSLLTERAEALREVGVADAGEREAWHVLFDAVDGVLRKAQRVALERVREGGG